MLLELAQAAATDAGHGVPVHIPIVRGDVRVSGTSRTLRTASVDGFEGSLRTQVGLISVLFREFRWVVRLALLYFVVFVVYAGIKASLLFGTSTPEELLWSDGGFAAVAIIARLGECRWLRFPCVGAVCST